LLPPIPKSIERISSFSIPSSSTHALNYFKASYLAGGISQIFCIVFYL